MKKEQRHEARFPVKDGQLFTVLLKGTGTAVCAIENISSSGMRLNILGFEDECPFFNVGDEIKLESTPAEEGGADELIIDSVPVNMEKVVADRTGVVVWKHKCTCGIRLHSPVDFFADLIGAMLEQEGLLEDDDG